MIVPSPAAAGTKVALPFFPSSLGMGRWGKGRRGKGNGVSSFSLIPFFCSSLLYTFPLRAFD